jgi:hypothetical protein
MATVGVVFIDQNGEGTGARLRKFRIGDFLFLRPGTLTWGIRQDLKDKVGRVVAIVDDGSGPNRITVACDKIEFTGLSMGFFSLLEQNCPGSRQRDLRRGKLRGAWCVAEETVLGHYAFEPIPNNVRRPESG